MAKASNGRAPRVLRTYAFTPICRKHRRKMTVYRYADPVVYFRCEAKVNGERCDRTGKAPVVLFLPAGQNASLQDTGNQSG